MGLLDSLFPPTNTNWGTILGEAPTYQPNPYVNFYDQNRNKITGALAGLVGSGSDPRAALMGLTQGALQGGQADSVYQQKQADIKQQQDQQNRTVAYLQKVAPQYAQAVQAGAISPTDAYKQYLTDQNGGMTAANTPSSIQEYNLYKTQVPPGKTPMSYLEYKQSTASGGSAGTDDDAAAIAQAIIDGKQPPDTKGLYKLSGPIRAQLAAQGYNYTQANEDWNATQKLLQSLNGAQQIRLRQAVQQTTDSLDLVDQLAQQWKGSGFPLFNKANLTAASQGAYGPQAQSLATQLVAEINDVTSDLGTVYKGGNSSTDESLRLAASQLSADWSEDTLRNAIALAKQNLAYRQNSLKLSTGGIDNSQYGPAGPADLPPANVGPSGVTSGASQNYVYDPVSGELVPQ